MSGRVHMTPALAKLKSETLRLASEADAEIARLESINADLLAALRYWLDYAEEALSQFDLDECKMDLLCPKCRAAGCINFKIRAARAAVAKATTP